MEFRKPEIELVTIEFTENIATAADGSNVILCTPMNGQPGGGWHCSNNAWSFNNCMDDAPNIC